MTVYIGDTLVSGVATKTVKNSAQLLEARWFDHLLNNQEWLRSDTFSWQSGEVYTSAYNHLVADLVDATAGIETVAGYSLTVYTATDGHKIVLDDEESTVVNIFNATGVAWYYIVDTTNTRFKLPRTKYGFNGLRDEVGKFIEAGLPNITATGGYKVDSNVPLTGAFYYDETSIYRLTNAGAQNGAGIGLDASLSNSIYGASNTVQPPATQMYLYFYVGQFSQSATEQTAGITTEQLNQKLDLDMGNATSITKQTIVGLGIPDYSAGVNVSVPTSGSKFTAPKDGVYICHFVLSNSTSTLYINRIETPIFQNNAGTSRDYPEHIIPLSKNDEIYWSNSSVSNYAGKFYPYKGSI